MSKKNTNIDKDMYEGDIEHIVFTKSNKSINSFGFRSHETLKSITIKGDDLLIKYGAFLGCKKLEKIIIEGNVKKIEEHAFGRCNALKEVIFTNSLNNVHSKAFSECLKLKDIHKIYEKEKEETEVLRAKILNTQRHLTKEEQQKILEAFDVDVFLKAVELNII